MLDAVVSWPSLLVALLVFGFAPGALLRLIVLAFRRHDPRRRELIAELHAVPRLERPFWVIEQLEVALSEGLYERLVWMATGRVIHRWKLRSGVQLSRAHPDTFWIPDPTERALIQPGVCVKLVFEMRDGFGERMWVDVIAVGRRYAVGRLSNTPRGIPRLSPGELVRFRPEHVIGLDFRPLRRPRFSPVRSAMLDDD
jgi:hypothetical protein